MLWLNAVRTKLAAEGYRFSEPLLLLLSQGIDLYYRSAPVDGCWNLSAKSPQLLQNLAGALGLYLEDFHTERLDRLYEEIHKTLSLYWLPMIELSAQWLDEPTAPVVPDLLLLVTGRSADLKELVLLHPDRQEYVQLSRARLEAAGQEPSALPLREGRRGWRWMLLNSPSPIKPVLPPIEWSLTTALHGWTHRFLYGRDLGGAPGQTGLAAFRHWSADLQRLADGAVGIEAEALRQRLRTVVQGEFGPDWGRRLWAEGLREAAPILGCELAAVAEHYEQLAEAWSRLTHLFVDPEPRGPALFREAARQVTAIASLEESAARRLRKELHVHGVGGEARGPATRVSTSTESHLPVR
ncbi:MAG TPA: DUF4872 domain-containing protein [Symbiobacteriaceae bacterium]|nr:DUF4872 domain-containing protein [Symbiobacteriaceae bacterium]